MQIIVKSEYAEIRLDKFLAFNMPQMQRSVLKNLIETEKVQINEVVEYHPQYKVKVGDKVELDIPEQTSSEIKLVPVNLPLEVIHEDTDLLILNKPSGLPTHPSPLSGNESLLAAVKFHLQKQGEDLWDANRAGLVHRLDKNTSGVIVFAKNPQALTEIANLFAERKVEKQYLAVVAAKFPLSLTVNSAINNQPALTEFSLLDYAEDGRYSVILAKPETGRKHQLRIHLANAKFPIVGDKRYGGEKAPRLMLHAWKISFPWKGEIKEFEATIPAEFSNFIVKTTG